MRILRLIRTFIRDFIPMHRERAAKPPKAVIGNDTPELPYFNMYLRCKRTSSAATVDGAYRIGEPTDNSARLCFTVESVEIYEEGLLEELKPEMLSIFVSFRDKKTWQSPDNTYSARSLTRPKFPLDNASPRNYREDGIVIYIDMPLSMYQMVYDAETLTLMRGYFMEDRKDLPDGVNIASASLWEVMDRHAAIRFKSASFSKWEPSAGKGKKSVKQLTENFVHREYNGTLDS